MTTQIKDPSASRDNARGVVFVHSAPSALCPHIEWAVAGVLGVPVSLDWTPQPAQAGTYRAELFWSGAVASLRGRGVEEMRDALGRLRVKELILPNEPPSFSGEQEFTFRHGLLRDGAYDSLPKALRAWQVLTSSSA